MTANRSPPSQLVEVKYEDLNQDPERELERVYEVLRLEGFPQVRSGMLETAAPAWRTRLAVTTKYLTWNQRNGLPASGDSPSNPLGYQNPCAGQIDKTPEVVRPVSDAPPESPCLLESGASTQTDSIPKG